MEYISKYYVTQQSPIAVLQKGCKYLTEDSFITFAILANDENLTQSERDFYKLKFDKLVEANNTTFNKVAQME